ncbi:hypothetical protein H7J86_32500 [Mycobacterium hackensackense]|uniref:hypothetical protein n=1 Tax=Mycobacterium hackensackense TaxID=228909 RepID=UPI0022658103|nr:hypothetical protein [Mycobacterium hackensackense]MCV7256906.1 hypothetical protein [Mycobacterium hackensackense]
MARAGRILATAALLVIVVGCDDNPPPWNSTLTDSQARQAMTDLGIRIPADYSLVGMTSVAYPVGHASYRGAFDYPIRGKAPVMPQIDGAPPAAPVPECDPDDQKLWASYGFTCAMTSAQSVSFRPRDKRITNEITAVTAIITPGHGRFFIYSTGT